MVGQVTRDTFALHLHSPFHVRIGSASIDLALVEVSPLRTSPSAEAFSLVFCGPAALPLPQAEYHFEHDVVGAFPLFIVPIGADADGRQYEAIVNRLRREDQP